MDKQILYIDYGIGLSHPKGLVWGLCWFDLGEDKAGDAFRLVRDHPPLPVMRNSHAGQH